VIGNTNKLEKKHIESFRRLENAIKEEAIGLNVSDDEQDILATPNESKDKFSNSIGENKMIKNPTYARITHASKQMEFLG